MRQGKELRRILPDHGSVRRSLFRQNKDRARRSEKLADWRECLPELPMPMLRMRCSGEWSRTLNGRSLKLDITKGASMETTEPPWNFRYAPTNLELAFQLPAGSIWKRWRLFSCCLEPTGLFSFRAEDCRPGRQSEVNGFAPNKRRGRQNQEREFSNRTDCSSAETVPIKIWASILKIRRSASSETHMVARRNL